MRIELEQLKASVAAQHAVKKGKMLVADEDITPESSARARAELAMMKDSAESEHDAMQDQTAELLGAMSSYSEDAKIRAIDTGKAELDTDIDTFMKEI
jgi:hypothetical protein